VRSFFQALERFIVDDEAKSALMVEKFQRYGGNPAVSVATALLDGMFALFQQAHRDPAGAISDIHTLGRPLFCWEKAIWLVSS